MPHNLPKHPEAKSKYHYYSRINYRGYKLYWLVLFCVIGVLISLPYIYVDVSVQSRGKITSLNKVSSVKAPLTARIVGLNITENIDVRTGDTLLVLYQSGLINEIGIYEQQIALHQQHIADLSILIEKESLTQLITPLYIKEQEDFKSSISRYNRKIDKLKVDFSRTSTLYNQGVLPLTTFQEDSFRLNEARDELLSYKTSAYTRWENERNKLTLEVHGLEGRIENLKQQQSQYVITAPFAGSIIDFQGVAIGNFVNENQLIARLSPKEELIAECYFSPAEIGFIHEGMEVSLQIDTYDYNQWGLLEAIVFEVGDDVILVNDEYMYLIRCRLKKNYLELSNKVSGPMKKGMSLTGRFVITRRTLYQLLFDKVDDWLNPKVMNVDTTNSLN